VIAGFRVWQLAFMSGIAFLCLIIALCCIYPCRIPRTIQEIDADYARKNLAEQFTEHLRKLSIKKELEEVLPAVTELEKQRVMRGSHNQNRSFLQRLQNVVCGVKYNNSISSQVSQEPTEDNDTTEDISQIENQLECGEEKCDLKDIKIEFISII
jgi:hypothetical protein